MLDLIKRNLLKYTLLVDGIVSVAAGTAFLTFSAVIAELIGPAFTGGVILCLGGFLFVWGLFHLAMNGIVSVAAGTAFLTFSAVIAELIGPAFTGGVILCLGGFLFVWGLFHLAMSSRDVAPAGGVRVAIAGDALWVLGSIAVLVADWEGLTTVGAAFIAVLAVAVADIMLLKMKGLGDRRRTVEA